MGQSHTTPASHSISGGTPGETITFGKALELGVITIDRLTEKPCWFCNQLRISTDKRNRVDSLLLNLPLYCCPTCMAGFELILEDETPDALLRTLSARATVKKVIPYDVFVHFTVTCTYDLPAKGGELEKCYICSENLSTQMYCVTMPCKSHHRFHKACMRPWLEGHRTCPTCRFETPIEEGAVYPTVEQLVTACSEEELIHRLGVLQYFTAVDEESDEVGARYFSTHHDQPKSSISNATLQKNARTQPQPQTQPQKSLSQLTSHTTDSRDSHTPPLSLPPLPSNASSSLSLREEIVNVVGSSVGMDVNVNITSNHNDPDPDRFCSKVGEEETKEVKYYKRDDFYQRERDQTMLQSVIERVLDDVLEKMVGEGVVLASAPTPPPLPPLLPLLLSLSPTMVPSPPPPPPLPPQQQQISLPPQSQAISSVSSSSSSRFSPRATKRTSQEDKDILSRKRDYAKKIITMMTPRRYKIEIVPSSVYRYGKKLRKGSYRSPSATTTTATTAAAATSSLQIPALSSSEPQLYTNHQDINNTYQTTTSSSSTRQQIVNSGGNAFNQPDDTRSPSSLLGLGMCSKVD